MDGKKGSEMKLSWSSCGTAAKPTLQQKTARIYGDFRCSGQAECGRVPLCMLRFLQIQNPDGPPEEDGIQSNVLQISKSAEDFLYGRLGKMP